MVCLEVQVRSLGVVWCESQLTLELAASSWGLANLWAREKTGFSSGWPGVLCRLVAAGGTRGVLMTFPGGARGARCS